MRSLILLCAGAALLAGCTTDGNVYDMPVGDVYARLSNFRPEPSGTGPFGRLNTNVTGSGGRRVVWSASGSHGGYRCTATLVPVEPEQTRIDLSCGGGGPSSGAAAGLEANLIRKTGDRDDRRQAFGPPLRPAAGAGLDRLLLAGRRDRPWRHP